MEVVMKIMGSNKMHCLMMDTECDFFQERAN